MKWVIFLLRAATPVPGAGRRARIVGASGRLRVAVSEAPPKTAAGGQRADGQLLEAAVGVAPHQRARGGRGQPVALVVGVRGGGAGAVIGEQVACASPAFAGAGSGHLPRRRRATGDGLDAVRGGVIGVGVGRECAAGWGDRLHGAVADEIVGPAVDAVGAAGSIEPVGGGIAEGLAVGGRHVVGVK